MTDLTDEIRAKCGVDLKSCYQCGKCSNSCPVVAYMEMPPARMVKAILSGLREKALCANTIWLCTSCRACSTRCPQGIDFARVVDELTAMAFREGRAAAAGGRIARYHKTFTDEIRKRGRYRTRAADIFTNFERGLALLLRGRLTRKPRGLKDTAAVESAFEAENPRRTEGT